MEKASENDDQTGSVQRTERERGDGAVMESEAVYTQRSQRAKVYELRDSSWFDRGTGHCKVVYDDAHEPAMLIVQAEESSFTERGGEAEGQGESEGKEVLLGVRIEKKDIYARQQDTSILWTDPSTQLNTPLSFQDAQDCSDIWQFIEDTQRHPNNRFNDSSAEVTSSSWPLSASRILDVNHPGLGWQGQRILWQPPTSANIKRVVMEQEISLWMQCQCWQGRAKALEHILGEAYIKQLIGVFEEAEGLRNLDGLHALCSLMRTIILFADNGIIEYILQDEIFLGVIGMLEYGPEYPSLKASYRQFFQEISKFRHVAQIKDQNILRKIHQTYKLQYLKEVVLARFLGDPTFAVINSSIFCNQIGIIGYIQNDDALLVELFYPFRNVAPDNPNGAADQKKRDTVLFLHQLMLMGKQLHVPTTSALYRNLLGRGLLYVCEWAFRLPEAQILHAGAEMLALAVAHDLTAVRAHVLKEETGKGRTLIVEIIRLMTATENMRLASQMSDILTTLLGTAPGGEGPTAESFLTFLYDSFGTSLFQPLLDLPEFEANMASPSKMPQERSELLQNLVELLSFCVINHPHRAAYFMLSNPISMKVTSMLYLRDKSLRHVALRFVKACLKAPNKFIHRHYVENDLLLPLIVLLEQEGMRDNMLSSLIMEVLELIRKNNIKPLINYLFDNYRSRLEGLEQRPYLRSFLYGLITRWEQINEPPPQPPVVEADPSKAWSPSAEAEEEMYFNASDDDEVGPKLPIEDGLPIKRKTIAKDTLDGPPGMRATDGAAVRGSGREALRRDCGDGSDPEGPGGGQSPRLTPKAEAGSAAGPPMTPLDELAKNLGEVALKMKAKRQREEEEEEGSAALFVKARVLRGGSAAKPGSAAGGGGCPGRWLAPPKDMVSKKGKKAATPIKDAGR